VSGTFSITFKLSGKNRNSIERTFSLIVSP
jgi:hypothetical protein